MQKLGEKLGLPKLTFQVIRRTIATLGQKKGTPKDIQGVLRHSRLSTTTDVYMQEIPESVKATGGGHQQRTEAEAASGRSFLKISGQFPAKRFEVGPLSC
jgi:hypothetical protein